jgi:hypothetical protein
LNHFNAAIQFSLLRCVLGRQNFPRRFVSIPTEESSSWCMGCQHRRITFLSSARQKQINVLPRKHIQHADESFGAMSKRGENFTPAFARAACPHHNRRCVFRKAIVPQTGKRVFQVKSGV